MTLPSSPPGLSGTLLFHLNLSYSAIDAEERLEVVRRCYRPLLGLLDRLPWLVLAIEASGHTLERLQHLAPDWVELLRQRIDEGRVEFVGSGDSQLIGPLVPASVNRWNQRLGLTTYRQLLGDAPSVALVNEMAWSQGIVDAYAEAGYDALVTEWNNPRRAHPEWEDEWRFGTVRTGSPPSSEAGSKTRVLWADAVAFQKLQRAVMGEMDEAAYVEWVLAQRAPDRERHLFLYANDAEIFDYRPGRYRTEPPLPGATDEGISASEWDRLARILEALRSHDIAFNLPSRVLADARYDTGAEVTLNTAADPVPVKKQPKYNATRWALSGRNDVGINAACFGRARALEQDGGAPDAWRELCRAWASDLRTHLTEERWGENVENQAEARIELSSPDQGRVLTRTDVARHERKLILGTDEVEVVLLPRRGLAIESLRFPAVSEEPLVGTLPHGFFDNIDWAADFYSGHTVLEIPAHLRVTDLEATEPVIRVLSDRIEVRAEVETELGPLSKFVSVFADRLELGYALSNLGERPRGSLRTGFVTLLPEGFSDELFVACENGGAKERFPLVEDFDHGASVSALVSSRAAFGATDGRMEIEDGNARLELSWPNWQSAALPLMTCRTIGSRRFVRVAFSLAEVDETHRAGAPLYDFRLALSARRLAA